MESRYLGVLAGAFRRDARSSRGLEKRELRVPHTYPSGLFFKILVVFLEIDGFYPLFLYCN